MKIVVGLGNPGRKYAGTRHNIGFDVLQALAERGGAENWKSRFEAETAEMALGGERALLAAPQTYMNLSGRSVRRIVDFFQAPLSELLVVCDDFHLPCGRLRLRASGSAGGQKGLQNIIDHLGTTEFARLRIGIGAPGEGDALNFVLQKFSKSERLLADEAVVRAAEAAETWASSGIAAAMNQYNRTPDAT